MTDSIQDLRAAFSKAAVVISQSGISAIYTYSDYEWVYQPDSEHCDIYKRVFRELLELSDGFLIKFRKGFSIAFEFRMKNDIDTAVFYPPIDHQLSFEELHEISDRVFQNNGARKEFVEFFSGVDLSDDYAVMEKLFSWEELHRRESDDVINLPRILRFNKMLKALKDVQATGVECSELFEPQGEEDGGFLTLVFDVDNTAQNGFFGKAKDSLANLMAVSSEITFEANIKEGFVNLSFFA